MKIKDCMSRNVVSVGAQEPVSVAARLMSRYNLGFLPVQGENGRLCGVLTDRDVVLRCVAAGKPAEQMRVSEVMSAGVLSIEAGRTRQRPRGLCPAHSCADCRLRRTES